VNAVGAAFADHLVELRARARPPLVAAAKIEIVLVAQLLEFVQPVTKTKTSGRPSAGAPLARAFSSAEMSVIAAGIVRRATTVTSCGIAAMMRSNSRRPGVRASRWRK
jgi:hypothetical protein